MSRRVPPRRRRGGRQPRPSPDWPAGRGSRGSPSASLVRDARTTRLYPGFAIQPSARLSRGNAADIRCPSSVIRPRREPVRCDVGWLSEGTRSWAPPPDDAQCCASVVPTGEAAEVIRRELVRAAPGIVEVMTFPVAGDDLLRDRLALDPAFLVQPPRRPSSRRRNTILARLEGSGSRPGAERQSKSKTLCRRLATAGCPVALSVRTYCDGIGNGGFTVMKNCGQPKKA